MKNTSVWICAWLFLAIGIFCHPLHALGNVEYTISRRSTGENGQVLAFFVFELDPVPERSKVSFSFFLFFLFYHFFCLTHAGL